jgi:hypothetical protein
MEGQTAMRCLTLAFAFLAGLISPATAETPHLALELNKAEVAGTGCRLTFKATNYFPNKLDDINVEVYLVDAKGIVLQSVQFPFGYVLAGKTRFAKFDIRNTACTDIGGMFVNEFKSCKGATDMAVQCRESLITSNLTAIKFSDGSP